VLVDGVEMTFTVEFSGTLPLSNKLSNVNGEDLRSSEIMVITTSDGQRYFFLTDGSATSATMGAFPNGAHSIDNVDTAADVLICFSVGTDIETPNGNRKVEDLRVGDVITTLSGPKTLRWIGVRPICARELREKPHFRPVIIKKDALGTGRPSADLSVSPNHRVLLSGWQMELSFATEAMLCASKHLVNNTTIKTDSGATSAEYYHLMFDEHEIVFSNGLPTESLLAGTMSTAIGSVATEYEFKELFGARAKLVTSMKSAAYPLMRHYEAKLVQPLLAA